MEALRLEAARLALDGAVAEVGACCHGSLELAGWEAQRRWAHSLYRWSVLSGCHPAWDGLASPATFKIQASRLNAAYVVAVAVRPSDWLKANAATLPPAVAEHPLGLERLIEETCVLGIFEQEIERARGRRDTAVRLAESDYDSSRRKCAEVRTWAEKALAKARAEGKPFDYDRAFASQRAELDKTIAENRKQIRAVQEEFWEYQRNWTEKSRVQKPGSIQVQVLMGEYKKIADAADAKIKAITKDMLEREERRDQLSRGLQRADVEEIETPAPVTAAGTGAAKPTPSPRPTTASPGGR